MFSRETCKILKNTFFREHLGILAKLLDFVKSLTKRGVNDWDRYKRKCYKFVHELSYSLFLPQTIRTFGLVDITMNPSNSFMEIKKEINMNGNSSLRDVKSSA